MRENLVLTGIQEKEREVPESIVREFLRTALQIPREAIDKIQLEHVHCFGQRGQRYDHPIVAKFASFKDKIMTKILGKRLAGTKIGMNDQFPKEIAERRKVLCPISKKIDLKGKQVALVVNTNYILITRCSETQRPLHGYFRNYKVLIDEENIETQFSPCYGL
jgi:hypothetical protein